MIGARPVVAQAPGVVGAVGEETGRVRTAEQTAGTDQVVGVAGREQQGSWTALVVGQRVDFGRSPAARAADGVGEGPPFAPAAERWALT